MEILEKVKSSFPKGVVDRVELEGCEIVVYTKDKVFFLDASDQVKELVGELKKRIEVRLDNSLCVSPENAKEKIEKIIPEEAKVKDIRFEPERSLVIITAEKPGLVIGRRGETFKKMKEQIFWVPRIERVPEIHSKIVKSIRQLMHEEVKWRQKFLKDVGKNIFSEKTTNRDWIRIFCLGGFREVGRSCILVETPKSRILMDCGVNTGGNEENRYPLIQAKEFDMSDIDAIILTHCHLDHCGFVPYLYEYGYKGPLYCTTPTLDLFTMLNLDYIDVMQRTGVQPPFTVKGVKEAIKHSITLDYNEVSDVGSDVRLTFQPSGHILGGAQIHLHVGQGLHNIVYSGDVKFIRSRLYDPAFTNFQRVETLILESTYGSQQDVMPPRYEAESRLMSVVNRTMERKGFCLIPSFGVQRSQDVMGILAENNFEYPVFIDGMIWDATAIYTAYPEYLSITTERKILQGNNPFTKDIFKRIASPKDREKAWEERPAVVLSTSGMLSGGPILEHLKALGEDKKNTLVFVGYQAEGGLGRRIQKGWRQIPINIDGKIQTMNLELEVETIDGLSGHADVNELINFVRRLRSKPERIILNHGDNTKPLTLGSTLHKLFRIETLAPKNLETIRLR